jgi:hypothetical protein
METQATEQLTPGARPDEAMHEVVEDAFQAADAPATSGISLLDDTTDSDVPGTDPDEDVPDEDVPAEPSPGDIPPDKAARQGQS